MDLCRILSFSQFLINTVSRTSADLKYSPGSRSWTGWEGYTSVCSRDALCQSLLDTVTLTHSHLSGRTRRRFRHVARNWKWNHEVSKKLATSTESTSELSAMISPTISSRWRISLKRLPSKHQLKKGFLFISDWFFMKFCQRSYIRSCL